MKYPPQAEAWVAEDPKRRWLANPKDPVLFFKLTKECRASVGWYLIGEKDREQPWAITANLLRRAVEQLEFNIRESLASLKRNRSTLRAVRKAQSKTVTP